MLPMAVHVGLKMVPARLGCVLLCYNQVHGAVEPFWLIVEDADGEVSGGTGALACGIYNWL